MTVKVSFLGTQVLYYDSTAEDSGIVFELGKTIDLTTDTRQKPIWRRMPQSGGSVVAVATASYNAEHLSLDFQHRVQDSRSGRTLSVWGHSMKFRTCLNTCQAVDYFMYFDNGQPMQRDNQKLVNQTCRVG